MMKVVMSSLKKRVVPRHSTKKMPLKRKNNPNIYQLKMKNLLTKITNLKIKLRTKVTTTAMKTQLEKMMTTMEKTTMTVKITTMTTMTMKMK
jgi:hypothetical protein